MRSTSLLINLIISLLVFVIGISLLFTLQVSSYLVIYQNKHLNVEGSYNNLINKELKGGIFLEKAKNDEQNQITERETVKKNNGNNILEIGVLILCSLMLMVIVFGLLRNTVFSVKLFKKLILDVIIVIVFLVLGLFVGFFYTTNIIMN